MSETVGVRDEVVGVLKKLWVSQDYQSGLYPSQVHIMKNIYFVRHGESEGNQARLYQSSETSLSEKGHSQAKLIADRFSNIEVEIIISSDYIRAKQTSQYISEVKGGRYYRKPII